MIYKSDLHIHTVLSPCASLEMSPSLIINQAKRKGLDIIGIADHNSTRNAEITYEIAKKNNLLVLTGAEITTKEEVHCLCFMPDIPSLIEFENFIESKRNTNIDFYRKKFEQYVVDENENIIDEIQHYLIDAIDVSISDLQKKVDQMNGIFIPAHVDRAYFSLSSQLGFVPKDLKFDVLEITPHANKNDFFETFPWFKDYKYITNSDAHVLADIGKAYTELIINEELSFQAVKNALNSYSLIKPTL